MNNFDMYMGFFWIRMDPLASLFKKNALRVQKNGFIFRTQRILLCMNGQDVPKQMVFIRFSENAFHFPRFSIHLLYFQIWSKNSFVYIWQNRLYMDWMRNFLIIILSFFLMAMHAQKGHIFSGKVVDRENGLGLPGAHVYIVETGRGYATDTSGAFSIALDRGSYHVVFSFLGYGSDTLQLQIKNNVQQTILLSPTGLDVEEVKLYGNRNQNVEGVSSGTVKIKSKEIHSLPTFLGENDPIKALQLTPGIQGSKEGFSGLYIRGGSPDQNLILLDGATLYNPSHLYGFFSVFNPDIIENVSLTKSGMDAAYGGRLASVVEISTRDGDFKSFSVNGSLGILASRITLEGPVIKDKVSIMFSGRRTYIHEMLKMLKEPLSIRNKTIQLSNYHFHDLNGKLSIRANAKNNISFTAYSGGDIFKYSGRSFGFNTQMDWYNQALALNWGHTFNPGFYMKHTLGYSGYAYGFSGAFLDYAFDMSSFIENYQYKTRFTNHNTRGLYSFGWEFNKYQFKPTGQSLSLKGYERDLVAAQVYHSCDAAGFFSATFNWKRWKMETGARFTGYFQTGPYYEWFEKGDGLLEDSLVNKKGEIIAFYPGFEPRFSARYLINAQSSLKFSFTINNQYVHIAPVSAVSLPTDIWVPSTSLIKPQKGYQAATGYYRNFNEDMYEFSLEAYWKQMYNLIEFKNSAIDMYEKIFENKLLFGNGRSAGLELFVKKNNGRFQGWIGYTLAFAQRRFDGMNDGNMFYAKYDRRHDISWVNTYDLNKKWKCSLVLVFASGNAYTMPAYRYLIQGKVVNGYEGINTFRMPDYHRADVSFTRTLSSRRFSSEINFSVYNVYNHQNPYYIVFNTLGSIEEKRLEVQPEYVSLYAILPSVSIKFNFK
jgi:hypothetical protein